MPNGALPPPLPGLAWPGTPDPRNDVPAVVSAAALLGHRRALVIEHGGEHYQLRITRNGKLILTK